MDTEKPSIYSERYVAFIDILGFGNIVRRSVQSPEQAEALVQIFDRMHKRWSDQGLQATHEHMGEDFRVQSFSDCTVISEAATPKGLMYLLLMVTQFSLDLMVSGFLVRGGIAKGLLHHSDQAVFGPAFLDAYALERDIACYPRIIVDKGTHKDFENNHLADNWDDFSRPALRHDDDGPVFVDVFSAFRVKTTSAPSRVPVTGKAIRANIQKQLDDSIYNPAHFKKLRWLTIYWNRAILLRGDDVFERVGFPVARDAD
jgi:hypothetical protein